MTTTSYTHNGHEITIESFSPNLHIIHALGTSLGTARTVGAAKRKANRKIDWFVADEAERAARAAKYAAMSDDERRAELSGLSF